MKVFSARLYEAISDHIIDMLNDEDRDKKDRLRVITGHLLALGIKEGAKKLAAKLLKSTALIRIGPRICTPVSDKAFLSSLEMLILINLIADIDVEDIEKVNESQIIDKAKAIKKETIFATLFVSFSKEGVERAYRALLKIAKATGSKNYLWYKENKDSITDQLWTILVEGNIFLDSSVMSIFDEDIIRMGLVHEFWHSQMLKHYNSLKGKKLERFKVRMKKFVDLLQPYIGKIAESIPAYKNITKGKCNLFQRFTESATLFVYPPVAISEFEPRLRPDGIVAVYIDGKYDKGWPEDINSYRIFVYSKLPFMKE